MVDETTDISVKKQSVLYVKIVGDDGYPQVLYGELVELQNGQADTIFQSIRDFLTRFDKPITDVLGFGSDGANVMTGVNNGVGKKLKDQSPKAVQIHCVAHRLALAASYAAKSVEYLKEYQSTITQIFNFYQYSAVRYNKIRELRQIMRVKVKKFKKPTSVRWLSTGEAVETLREAWPCLVLGLDFEASHNKSPEAKGILKKVGTYLFLTVTCLVCDVLGSVQKLSLCFQKELVDIAQAKSMLVATKQTIAAMEQTPGPELKKLFDYLENSEGKYGGVEIKEANAPAKQRFNSVKRKFIQKILKELESRFPAADRGILSCLDYILSPKYLPLADDEIGSHGEQELETVIKLYGKADEKSPAVIDADQARKDYMHFKYLLNSNRHLTITSMCAELITKYAAEFPDFATLAKIYSIVPITSVACERGFSSQNRIKTKLRNRLAGKSVDNLMRLSAAAKRPYYDEDELVDKACSSYVARKRRRF